MSVRGAPWATPLPAAVESATHGASGCEVVGSSSAEGDMTGKAKDSGAGSA